MPERPDTSHTDVVEVLQNIRGGACLFDLATGLEMVVAAVRETGKDGVLTLKLKIKPLDSHAETVNVTDHLTLTTPVPDKKPSIFFSTEQNTLCRRDPRQMEFIHAEE